MQPSLSYDFFVTDCEISLLDSNDELLQTSFWGDVKKLFGWIPVPLTVSMNGIRTNMLVLVRKIFPGLSLAYIPLGPQLPEPELQKEKFLISLGQAIRSHLPKTTFVVRFDPPWARVGESGTPGHLRKRYFLRKAMMDIQPPSTVVLDIKSGNTELLSGMKHKTRYNIKLAEKKGVKFRIGSIEELGVWYRLYKETGTRDKIAIHSIDYYKSIFEIIQKKNTPAFRINLLLAEVGNVVVAGIIIAIKDKRCWYLYGASSNEMRNYMPNHLLQWKAIQYARESGCTEYDFFGIPPKPDPAHPMFGLYRFKTGFGGRIVNRFGCYDIPYKPILYRIYSLIEKGRNYYYKNLKKRI